MKAEQVLNLGTVPRNTGRLTRMMMNKRVIHLPLKSACSLSFLFTALTSLARKPRVPELLNFKTSSGSTVDIVAQIGKHYAMLGIMLLDDDSGAVISEITEQHKGNPVAINREILTRWVRGQGKQPVIWSTLIDVLRDMELSQLAEDIQKALTSSAQPFGETVTCQLWYTISSF